MSVTTASGTPFIPKEGPKLGSRKQTIDCFPILLRPSLKPTEVVVFPSPAGVGVIAVTKIKLLFSFKVEMYSKLSFAIWRPIGCKQKDHQEYSAWQVLRHWFISAARAISISDFILFIKSLFGGGLGRIALTTHTFSGYCSTTELQG